jgi:hypothetical protein
MKSRRLSPNQIAGLVFLAAVLIPTVSIALLTLLVPGAVAAETVESINTVTCPAAIVLGVVAYFWAKNRS